MAKKAWLERLKRGPKYSTRQKNRCVFCGRARSFIRKFGVCRICFRRLAHEGRLPGVTKSSW
ncbi:MAG: type Z 30S ribosomal protein S14 [bacterium]|nr:type Z 30S ribosomal protein S14 [Candidatus Margulisiibacteriota bacterium]